MTTTSSRPSLPAETGAHPQPPKSSRVLNTAVAVGFAALVRRPRLAFVDQRPPRRAGARWGRSRRAVRDLFAMVLAAGVAVATVGSAAAVVADPITSSAQQLVDIELDIPEQASLPPLQERSTIHDADGSLLQVVDRETSRRVVPLARIPEHVQQAVTAAEDRKFYEHPGYDVEGIGRAALANLRAGNITEGGSTITQQLAKTQVGADRTLERKASELLYAVALENTFSKDEMLERYLNLVYFGSRAYGIAAAAEEFFHTTPRKLKVHQSALLASLIRAPNAADPRRREGMALRRRNTVLRAMAEEGHITGRRLRSLLRQPLGVRPASPQPRVRERYVIDAVKRELLGLKGLGDSRREREQMLYYGGLRITTTLDTAMQRKARRVIRDFLPYGAPTAAIATVDPATGAIKAVASGLHYRNLEYDLPTQGRRQPGSAFKPFVYAAALQQGFPLNMSLSGRSPAYFEGVPGWERDCNVFDKDVCGVSNYGGASYGRMNMAEALQKSVNTAAAELTISVGPERVARLAANMNIDIAAATNGFITESIGLGGLDHGVTPLEMAAAYSVFANAGQRVRPHLIARVEDSRGRILYEAKAPTKRVLHPAVNAAVVDLMRGVVTGGTGTGAALPGREVAGKTGTTSNNVDAWFVGYTPTLSTAVWVGHPRGQVEMPNMTGGAVPASIWREYMSDVLQNQLATPFPTLDREALAARAAEFEVTVPDVVGLQTADALAKLGNSKLVGDLQPAVSSAPQGTVAWQTPAPGQQLNPGEDITLGVSNGMSVSPLQFPTYIPPPLNGPTSE